MLFFVCLAILAFYFAVFYRSQSIFTEQKYTWGKTPSIISILFKVLVRIIRRRQGRIYHSREENGWTDAEGIVHLAPSPDEIVIINGFRITDDLIAQYKSVFGDKKESDKAVEAEDSRTVPLCFPDCLFMHNLLLLVCKPSFKLSPLGLIHIRQTITRHGNLQQLLDRSCSLEAQTTVYRLVPRGVEVDVSVRVIADSQLCVWSGVATLLSRSRHVQSSGGTGSSTTQQIVDVDWELQENISSQQIEVAADTGLKYARVSGDWNPHHLYPWSARLLGYQAPIAHGLWTLAKAVDLLEDTRDDPSSFSKVECRFKRPLFLPGSVILQQYTDGSTIKFRVVDSKTRAPHVVGTVA